MQQVYYEKPQKRNQSAGIENKTARLCVNRGIITKQTGRGDITKTALYIAA